MPAVIVYLVYFVSLIHWLFAGLRACLPIVAYLNYHLWLLFGVFVLLLGYRVTLVGFINLKSGLGLFSKMALMAQWLPNRKRFFKVFTLVDTNADKVYKYKWAEVTSFNDYILFFGADVF